MFPHTRRLLRLRPENPVPTAWYYCTCLPIGMAHLEDAICQHHAPNHILWGSHPYLEHCNLNTAPARQPALTNCFHASCDVDPKQSTGRPPERIGWEICGPSTPVLLEQSWRGAFLLRLSWQTGGVIALFPLRGREAVSVASTWS